MCRHDIVPSSREENVCVHFCKWCCSAQFIFHIIHLRISGCIMVTKLHCQQTWGTHKENERHIVSEVRVMDVFKVQNRACLPILSKRIYIYLLNSSQHHFFTPPLQLPSIFTPALCLHPRTSPVLFTTCRRKHAGCFPEIRDQCLHPFCIRSVLYLLSIPPFAPLFQSF